MTELKEIVALAAQLSNLAAFGFFAWLAAKFFFPWAVSGGLIWYAMREGARLLQNRARESNMLRGLRLAIMPDGSGPVTDGEFRRIAELLAAGAEAMQPKKRGRKPKQNEGAELLNSAAPKASAGMTG